MYSHVALWLFGIIALVVVLFIVSAVFQSIDDVFDNDEDEVEANVPNSAVRTREMHSDDNKTPVEREPSTIERFRDIAKT